jgi:hypothetical protein
LNPVINPSGKIPLAPKKIPHVAGVDGDFFSKIRKKSVPSINPYFLTAKRYRHKGMREPHPKKKGVTVTPPPSG